jgi:hypothetical protein
MSRWTRVFNIPAYLGLDAQPGAEPDYCHAYFWRGLWVPQRHIDESLLGIYHRLREDWRVRLSVPSRTPPGLPTTTGRIDRPASSGKPAEGPRYFDRYDTVQCVIKRLMLDCVPD